MTSETPMETVDTLLARILEEFSYPHQWATSGLVSKDFLELQWRNSLVDEEWQRHHASRDIDPRAGTEHWRIGAFGIARQHPDVIAGGKLPELLQLIELDPDPGMAQSVAYALVAEDTLLSEDIALVAARHPVMAISSGSFEAAQRRLERSDLTPHERRETTERTLARATAQVQMDILKSRRDIPEDPILEWLKSHGKNGRVRRYAKQGTYLKSRFARTLRR